MIKIKDDKLNRQQFLKGLFSLFRNFGNQGDRGFTMIINGKFGSGKSTLLGFIEEQCKQVDDFEVVKYNAWDNNLFPSPLVPILYAISKLEKKPSKIKNGAISVLKMLPKIFLSTLANAHGVDLTSVLEYECFFDDYDKYKEELLKFRNILTEYCKDKKVLFLIDELDRCLPEYQIKVLEAIYHLLEIPNLIVIIALDKEQLECSVKSKFGDNKNTLGYLSKFINYQVDLPDDGDEGFIRSLMAFNSENEATVKSLIARLLKILNCSIRDCQFIINEINLICNEVDAAGEKLQLPMWYPFFVSLIVIIKHENDSIYRKYFIKYKDNYKSISHIHFNESEFFAFLNCIKGTSIEPIMLYLTNYENQYDRVEKVMLLHFIDAFTPVKLIEEEELADFLDLSVSALKQLLMYSGNFSYPYSINNLISKIKNLNFKTN